MQQTLKKKFRSELKTGAAMANETSCQAMFAAQKETSGETAPINRLTTQCQSCTSV